MGAHAERMKLAGRRGSSPARVEVLTDIPLEISIEGDTGLTQRWERERDVDATKQFNDRVGAWATSINNALRAKLSTMGIGKSGKLDKSIKANLWHFGKKIREGQEVTSIGFSFKPQGIYVHLGLGRGYEMDGGVVVKKTRNSKTNLQMMRQPKDWFDSTITEHLGELEKIVMDYTGALFINATRIYINKQQ